MSLFEAIAAGDEDALREEIERNPSGAGERNEDGVSPVLYALFHGRSDLVGPILDANPALDVFDAAAVGRTRGLEELIEAEPALVHARAANGTTPLHLAVRFDQRGAAELLLEHGADTAARDGDGRTPAEVAAGDTRALSQLAEWLCGQPGREADAEATWLEAASAGDRDALGNLASCLQRQLGRQAEADRIRRLGLDAHGRTVKADPDDRATKIRRR